MNNKPVALEAEPKIRNCRFKYECDMHWNDLKETSRPNVRFCETCSKEVHFVRNRVGLALAIQNNLCVCVPHDIFDMQEKAHIRPAPKPVQDPGDRRRPFKVTTGLIEALPAGTSSGKDVSDIPAWLRKQMD
jgi:hypothetical protein